MITDILIQNIKDYSKDFEIPLKELAEKIGITEQGLHSMFKKKNIKLETIEKIAEVLDVSVASLFDDGEEEEYWELWTEIKNAKLQVRKKALIGKGVIDIELERGRIILDFADLKEPIPLNYYERSDNFTKKLERLEDSNDTSINEDKIK